MAGKSAILSRTIYLIVTLTSLLSYGVLCYSHHRTTTPHMCNAIDESSEECNQFNDNLLPINSFNDNLPPINSFNEDLPPMGPGRGPLRATNFIIKYSLYTEENQTQTFTSENFETESKNLSINSDAQWKVLIHDFSNIGTTTFPLNVRDAYLRNMKNNSSVKYNVLIVDWSAGACASIRKIFTPTANAAESVKFAGQKLSDLLSLLHESKLLDVTKDVHLIGHGMGAYVTGNATERIYDKLNKVLWRISALDPSGRLFWKDYVSFSESKPDPIISRAIVHVQFLDAYHTSTSSIFGREDEIGDVDFYINGGRDQPSCEIDLFGFKITPNWNIVKMFLHACSHNYATEIFAESISNNSMKGCTGCKSYSQFEAKECVCVDNPVLGESVFDETIRDNQNQILSGKAYIITERNTSVGSNYLQMLKNNNIFSLLWRGWKGLCW